MSFNIQVDISTAIKQLEGLHQKQLPFAASYAINNTAKEVKEALIAQMHTVFDQPTPYTLDSLYLKPSSKSELTATIGLKEDSFKGIPAVKFLTPQIEGGTRHHKRFERALISRGIMPSGYKVVPGGSAKLDRYGNIPHSLIVELLAYLSAFAETGYKANMTDKRRDKIALGREGKRGRYGRKAVRGYRYFVVGTNDPHRAPGIYKVWRNGRNMLCIIKFVQQANYQKRYDYFGVAQRKIETIFPQKLREAVTFAIKTAK